MEAFNYVKDALTGNGTLGDLVPNILFGAVGSTIVKDTTSPDGVSSNVVDLLSFLYKYGVYIVIAGGLLYVVDLLV